jgi:hypothetical protein
VGTAVLASVFAAYGSYRSPADFIEGMRLAVWASVAVVVVGRWPASWSPRGRRTVPAGNQ